MRLAVILLVAACTRGSTQGSRTVTVIALAGEREEAGALIVSHAADGHVIDQVSTDAVGNAEVGVDDGALISVMFTDASRTSVLTTAAIGDELIVHGPARERPPLVAGVLQVAGPAAPMATSYDVQLGCAAVARTTLPAIVDVAACSMGMDTQLDVLVRALDADTLLGYSAGRIPMIDGVARLDIASWETALTPIEVTQDGVNAYVDLDELADGLPFRTPTTGAAGGAWTGLVAEQSRITATLDPINPRRVTVREVGGVPTSIALAAGDFLPELALSTTIVAVEPLTIAWDAGGFPADVVRVHARWEPAGSTTRDWIAVLPPDATTVTVPAAALGTSEPPIEVTLSYAESSVADAFAALGIYWTDAPRSGELKTTAIRGVR